MTSDTIEIKDKYELHIYYKEMQESNFNDFEYPDWKKDLLVEVKINI